MLNFVRVIWRILNSLNFQSVAACFLWLSKTRLAPHVEKIMTWDAQENIYSKSHEIISENTFCPSNKAEVRISLIKAKYVFYLIKKAHFNFLKLKQTNKKNQRFKASDHEGPSVYESPAFGFRWVSWCDFQSAQVRWIKRGVWRSLLKWCRIYLVMAFHLLFRRKIQLYYNRGIID